jgi:hypothetical protein
MLELDQAIGTVFVNLRERLTHTFTGGNGLEVQRFTPEQTAQLQKDAQAAKVAVDPTVAGYKAKIENIKARTAMTVAGLEYAGVEIESAVTTVEAIADTAEVTSEAISRLPAAMERYTVSRENIRQNAAQLNDRFAQIMNGGADFQGTIAPTEQKKRFAPR